MAWSWWGRFMRGIGAFQRAYFNPELDLSAYTSDHDLFCRWEPRTVRYQVLWAFYTNTQFWDEVHQWSQSQKQVNSLYAWTRPNYNPMARIVEFGATHLLGGSLDKDAGDGVKVKSAIPIDTGSTQVRGGLSRLWRDSRMVVLKDILSRKGCALGDIGIRVCDDPTRGRVTLKTVHPGTVKWVDRDHDTGRILGYQIEEKKYDPLRERPRGPYASDRDAHSCKYTEDAWIDGGRVHYATYRDGTLFDWTLRPDGKPFGTGPGAQPEWEVPYGFIPLVLIQHMQVDLSWGLAEGHTGLVKFLEMADVGSNIGDSIRRILNAPLAISGANPDANARDVTIQPAADATTGNPEPGRTKQGIMWFSDPAAKIQFTAQPIDVPGASAHVASLKQDATEDYPEIDMDLWKMGEASGAARRLARQRAENKIQQRRVGYDLGLEDAQRMALAIGGLRGYEGYQRLGTEDPFDDDVVAHSIMHRPVFQPDPLDDIEETMAKYAMWKAGVDAGAPLEWVMRQWGEDEKVIAELTTLKEEEAQKQMDQVEQRMKLAGENEQPDDEEPPFGA